MAARCSVWALRRCPRRSTYLLLAYLIDDVLGRGIVDQTLLWLALGFIGLALIEGAFTFFSGRLAARTSEGIAQRLRDYLYDHIQRLSFTYHDKAQTGELIQRSTSDVDAIRRFFADQAINAGRIVLLFVINFVALLRLYAPLAWFSVIVIPIVLVVSVWFFKRISTAYEAHQEQEAALSTTLQENLTGVRVVKAFARQAYERDKFERANWEKFRRGRRLLINHALYWPVTDILCGFQMLAGYIVGAQLVIAGTLSLGDYVAYRLAGLADLADAQPGPPDRADVHRVGVLRARDGCDQRRARTADRWRRRADDARQRRAGLQAG